MELSFRRVQRTESTALVELLTTNHWPFHAGESASASLAARWLQEGDDDASGTQTFWVLLAEDRVGLVRLTDLCDDTAMLDDLRIADPLRGYGIGTRVARWATDHVFSTCGSVRRVEATTRQDNVAMRRTLARCGYVKEAHYRQGWPAPDGRIHDAVGYSILRTDWSAGSTTPVSWHDDRPPPDEDLRDVVRKELLLLSPELRACADRVRELLHPDFVEYGASGRTWHGEAIAEALAMDAHVALEARNLAPVRLDDGVILVTYRVSAPDHESLRSSVWVRDRGRGWLLRFHQGTATS